MNTGTNKYMYTQIYTNAISFVFNTHTSMHYYKYTHTSTWDYTNRALKTVVNNRLSHRARTVNFARHAGNEHTE